MVVMETIGEIVRRRREEMRKSQEWLAEKVGVSQATIDKIENDRTKKSRFLPDVFSALELPFSSLPGAKGEVTGALFVPPARAFESGLTPVYGVAEGGGGKIQLTSDPVDFIATPHPLKNVKGAYAVIISGESMVPAYRPGQIALVHPGLPPRPGDDVILYSDIEDGETFVIIKTLVRRKSDRWIVEQYNPKKEIELLIAEWNRCHVVVGHYGKW